MTRDADEVFNRLDAEAQEFAAQDRVTEAVAARDAAWREAVARVRARREQDIADWATGAVLDEVLRAMEGQ